MNTDLAPLLVAVCGFAVVCLGVVFVFGLTFIRSIGGKIPMVFNMLGGEDSDEIEEESSVYRPRVAPKSARELQVKAQDLDFDSAVDKYRRKFDQSPPDPKIIPNTPPSSTTLTDRVSRIPGSDKPSFTRDPRDRRWGRVDTNAHDDEVLGGIFGDEDYDDEGGLF